MVVYVASLKLCYTHIVSAMFAIHYGIGGIESSVWMNGHAQKNGIPYRNRAWYTLLYQIIITHISPAQDRPGAASTGPFLARHGIFNEIYATDIINMISKQIFLLNTFKIALMLAFHDTHFTQTVVDSKANTGSFMHCLSMETTFCSWHYILDVQLLTGIW